MPIINESYIFKHINTQVSFCSNVYYYYNVFIFNFPPFTYMTWEQKEYVYMYVCTKSSWKTTTNSLFEHTWRIKAHFILNRNNKRKEKTIYK